MNTIGGSGKKLGKTDPPMDTLAISQMNWWILNKIYENQVPDL